MIGFGVVAAGVSSVDWGTVGRIAASWVVSPVAGGVLAFLMFFHLRSSILSAADPEEQVRRHAPYLVALVATILFLSFLYKGLSNVIDTPPFWMAGMSAGAVAAGAGVSARLLVGRRARPDLRRYDYVERVFGRLQVATAAYVAFAHGANDVANAIGPVAAVAHIATTGSVAGRVPVPLWVLVLGGLGIVIGLATWGYKVIRTIGREIIDMAPSRGFSAEFGAATTVLVCSLLGLPISTTHTLVGAVIGVGLAQGIGALNLRVVKSVVNSWIVTLPVAAALSALLFLGLRAVFV